MGFGTVSVNGLKRVPNPPTKIKAFMITYNAEVPLEVVEAVTVSIEQAEQLPNEMNLTTW